MRQAPVESENGDVLAQLDGVESWIVLRAMGDGQFKLIGRAVLLKEDRDYLRGRLPQPYPRKLTLFVSIAVLQLLCETIRNDYTYLW
jgi:hypothetical protein